MLKYVSAEREKLEKIKSGMEKNLSKWAGQTNTPVTVQATLDGLDKIGKEVDDLERLLSSKLADARRLTAAAKKEADNITKIAIGLEEGSPAQLAQYGIALKKAGAPKPAPAMLHHITIEDDTDKEGFKISTNFDPEASIYEWLKGSSSDPSNTNDIPELKFFKATKKTSFIDDDIVKGTRYFYRVRVTNTAGAGPWSETVSKVQ